MHLGRDFQPQRVEADEVGGVVLIVGLDRVGFHRGHQSRISRSEQLESRPFRAVRHVSRARELRVAAPAGKLLPPTAGFF